MMIATVSLSLPKGHKAIFNILKYTVSSYLTCATIALMSPHNIVAAGTLLPISSGSISTYIQ